MVGDILGGLLLRIRGSAVAALGANAAPTESMAGFTERILNRTSGFPRYANERGRGAGCPRPPIRNSRAGHLVPGGGRRGGGHLRGGGRERAGLSREEVGRGTGRPAARGPSGP